MNLAKSIAVVVIISLFGSIAASQAADQAVSKKAAAGSYRLVNGKGYTVCEAFLKNLNAFPADEPPMVCEQKIHPTHPEFSRPAWEELDVQSNLKLIYEAESLLTRFTPTGTQSKPVEEWEKKFQERIKSGEANPRLRKTVLDLNGNGPETLIWYRPIDSCQSDWEKIRYVDPGNSSGGYVFVWRSKTGKLEEFSGLVAAEGRTDVVLYKYKTPHFIDVYANRERVTIGLHPVGREYNERGQYVVPQRCDFRINLSQNP